MTTIVNSGLQVKGHEAVVTNFKAILCHSPRGTKQNHEEIQQEYPPFVPRI